MRGVLVLLVAGALAPVAAAKGPWAVIDGRSANPAHADEVDVLVRQVDTKRYAPPVDQAKVEPGPHWITLLTTRTSTPPLNFRRASIPQATYRPWVMKAEPCMRYRVAAQHDGPSAERWVVKVVAVDRIGDCTPPPVMPDAGVPPPSAAPAPAPADVAPAEPAPAPADVAPADAGASSPR